LSKTVWSSHLKTADTA